MLIIIFVVTVGLINYIYLEKTYNNLKTTEVCLDRDVTTCYIRYEK